MKSEVYRSEQTEVRREPIKYVNVVSEGKPDAKFGFLHTKLGTRINVGEEILKSRKLGSNTFEAIYVLFKDKEDGISRISPYGVVENLNMTGNSVDFSTEDFSDLPEHELKNKKIVITPRISQVLVMPNFVPGVFTKVASGFSSSYLERNYYRIVHQYHQERRKFGLD